MEDTDPQPAEEPREDPGEDHREGPPGYDLDEHAAIEELQEERSDER